MKDLKKASPERIQILQDIDSVSMEIEVMGIGYEVLTPSERKYINSQLEQLYTKRSSLQRRLRTMQ